MGTPRIRYSVAVSLDGFIAPEDGSAAWLEPYHGGSDFAAFLKTIGGIIMGRASYEQSLAFGPWYWKQPTVVMTSRPIGPSPPLVEPHSGTPAEAIEMLRKKMKGGDIWLFGGGKTASRFLDDDLIDTLELGLVPVALGSGIALFEGARREHGFVLTRCRELTKGVVMLDYQRAR